MRSRRGLVFLASVVLAVGVTAGLWLTRGPSGPALVSNSDGSATGMALDVPPGTHVAMNAGTVCVEGSGSVVITDVVPVDPRGGLRVTDFSVVDSASTIGLERSRLDSIPSLRGSGRVDGDCRTEDFRDLMLELFKPGDATASALEFVIHYRSGGEIRTADLLFGMGTCTEIDSEVCSFGDE